MSSFLWQIAKAAILEKKPEALKFAATLIATKLPVSADRVEAFLSHLVSLVTALGDGWLGNAETALQSLAMSTPDEAAAAGFYGSAMPPGDIAECPPELQSFKDVVVAFRQAD